MSGEVKGKPDNNIKIQVMGKCDRYRTAVHRAV